MKHCLLDVNVLLALGWQAHEHHSAANAWFEDRRGEPWATCPLTECGFIRIGSNQRLMIGGGSVTTATAVMNKLRQQPGHAFWPDDYSPCNEALFSKLQSHNQITDAYLLMLCVRRKARLVTFDAGLKTMSDALLGDARHVLLLPDSAG